MNDNHLEIFQDTIRRILTSQSQAREILSACDAEDDVSRATLTLVWSELLDELMRDSSNDDERLLRVVGIIQKLYGSTNQRRTMDLRLREFEAREAEREERKAALRNDIANAKSNGLTPAILERIEAELQLL